jgi:hypothetical protein
MCWPVKFDANYERKQYERQTLQRIFLASRVG